MPSTRRVLALAVILTAGLVASCDSPTVPPTVGGIAPRIAYVTDPTNTHVVQPLTSMRVTVYAAGTTNIAGSGTLTQASPPAGPWAGSVSGLAAGSYTLAIEGLVGSQVQHYGTSGSITVIAGKDASSTVPVQVAVPTTTPTLTSTQAFTQNVSITTINGATGYQIELADNAGFNNATASTSPTSNFVLAVPNVGTWFVRTRPTFPSPIGTVIWSDAVQFTVLASVGGRSFAAPIPVPPPVTAPDTIVNQNITPAALDAWYSIPARAGDSLFAATEAEQLSPKSSLNTFIQIFRADGTTEIASNDNIAGSTDSRAIVVAPATETYFVRVSRAAGTVGHFNVILEIRRLPALATGLTGIAASNSTVNLSWTDNADNEATYRIERCATAGCSNFAEVGSVNANITTYNDAGLTANESYSYRIRGRNAVGNSNFTGPVTVVIAGPTAPSALTATTISGAQIDLAWSDNSDNETGFRVERCTLVSCTNGDFSLVATLPSNTTSYQNTGLAVDGTYTYRVLALNNVASSAFTTPATANTLRPSAPSGLTAVTASATRIDLGWSDNAGNETGFRIERCSGQGCSGFAEIAAVGADVTSYADLSAAAETFYSYRVRAYNVSGNSSYTNASSANTRTPGAPSSLAATTISGSLITLSWADTLAAETGFLVERCAGNGCSSFAQVGTALANATSYNDNAVSVGNEYSYRIRATGVAGTSLYSATASATTLLPTAPTGLSVTTLSGTQLNLAWIDASSNEASFRIERCVGSGCSDFAEIAFVTANLQAYSDVTVTAENIYRYRIAARNAVGNSAYTSIVTASTESAVAPTSLSAVTVSATQVDLSWSDNAGNEDGFRIERCTGPGCSNFTQIQTVGPNVTTFQNTGVAAGNSYSYRVRAYNAVGNSVYTGIATATTSVPNAPTALSATAASATRIDLTWTDASTDETGFRIERCTGAGCTDFAEIGTTLGGIATFVDSGLVADTDYRYRVRAYNVVGNSTYSTTVNADTRVPAAPTGLAAVTVSGSRIDLSWTDNANNEIGFSIERCAGAGCSSFASITLVGPNTNSYSDLSVVVDSSYSYRIIAVNLPGNSPASNVATATTLLPVAPSGLTATTQSVSAIALAWTDNATDANAFIIERCSGAGCSDFAVIDSTVGVTTNFTDATVAAGTAYGYRVRARNISGRSAPSATATANTIVPTAPTTLVAATQSNTRIDLTWADQSSDEFGFYIERCGGAACSDFAIVDSVAADVTTYASQGLTPSSSYSFRVRAHNASGSSAASNTATATTNLPAIPTALTGTALTTTQVDLAWTDNATDELQYELESCTGPGCTDFALIATLPANTATYPNTGLTAGLTYLYRVRATNGAGASDYSNIVQVSTAVPTAPDGAVAAATSTTTATVSWTDQSDNEVTFRVERCQGVGCVSFVEVAALAGGTTLYQDAGLTVGLVYNYRIRAVNAIGTSTYSNTATASTIVPTAPASLTAQTISSTEIDLAWTDASANETGFELQRCQGVSCTDFTTVDSLAPNTTTFSNTGLPTGPTFRYRVRAFNGAGPSTFSNVASASTDVPNDPTDMAALATSDSTIHLAWTDNSNNEDGFVVQRCLKATCINSDYADIALVSANVRTFDDVLLAGDGDTATYRVKATNGNGESRYSNAGTAWTLVPDAPTALNAAIVTGARIDLGWSDNALNELYFEVERCGGVGCSNFARIDSLPAGTTSYSDVSVTTEQSYRYRVRAANLVGNSGYTNEAAENTILPLQPSALTASTLSATQISLAWTDNSDNELGFRVERCSGDACTNFAEVATIAPNSGAYADVSVVLGQSYAYRVVAFNNAGQRESNTATSTTLLPADPAALGASIVAPTTVRLTWTDASDNEAGFRIERCTGSGCNSFVEIAVVAAGVVQYDNTGVAGNTFYRYRVRAYNTAGESQYTPIVSSNTFPPAAPASLTTTMVFGNRVDVSWVDNANNESGFRIERCTGAACSSFAEIAVVGANVTTHQDSTLTFGNTYRYRVRSFNGVANSAYVGPTDGNTNVPVDPSALVAGPISTTAITLNWTDNSTNETGFRVERCAGPSCSTFAEVATVGANIATYTDNGLTPEAYYSYRVRAYNLGQSGYSNVASATTILPLAPSNPTATAVAGDRVDLTWTDNAVNENGFQVERCDGAACTSFVLVNTTAANATAYSDLNLANGQLHRYRIRAVNGAGTSAYTAIVEATTNVPGIPTTLTATTQTASRIDLAWTDNATDELGFVIERCTGPACSNFAVIDSVKAVDANAYSNTGLAPSTAYTYRVRAYNASGVSGVSNVATASTNTPADPTGITATTMGASTVQVSWTDNADNEAGYTVERCTGAACSDFAVISTLGANTVTLGDLTVVVDQSYRYRVRAFNNAGTSNYSTIADANTLRPAAPSALLATTISATRVDLQWSDDSDNETAFRVERCTGPGCSSFAQVAEVPAGTTVYADEGLAPSEVYGYRVIAANIAGTSAASNVATATTAIPSDPSNAVATTISATRIDLTWTDNSDNELGFVVERCSNACSDLAQIGTVGPNVTAYSDLSVSLGNDYTYYVKAQNAAGTSGAAPAALANTQVPGAQASLTVTLTGPTAIQLDWVTGSTNEQSYAIDRCTSAGCSNFVEIATIGVPVSPPDGARTYTDVTVAPGTYYTYRVRGTNAAGSGPESNASETAVLAPQAPTGLTALTLNESAVALNWQDNSFNETGFLIERCDGDGCSSFTQIDSIRAGEQGYQASGLTIGNAYTFRVRAVNPVGTSGYTNEVTATTRLADKVTNLTAVAAAPDRIDLTWTDNSNNEDGFFIERCAGAGCTSFVQIATVAPNTTDFANTGVVLNSYYSYRIRPYNAVGPTDYSDEALENTLLPADPINVVAIPITVNQVDINWTDVASNETGYIVESCVNGVSCPSFSVVASLPAGTTFYSDATAPNQNYIYRVRAVRDPVGSSNPAASGLASTVLTAPSYLRAQTILRNRIDLTWSDDSNIETNYQILICGGAGCTPTGLWATVPANTNTYQATGLPQNLAISFAIRAVSNGTVADSRVAGAYTPTTLGNGGQATGLTDTTYAERYFVLGVPAGSPEVRVDMSPGSGGEVDLFTKYGQAPTLYDWDCRPYPWGVPETCSHQNPAAGDWYLMPHAYQAMTNASVKAAYAVRYGFPNPFASPGSWSPNYLIGQQITITQPTRITHLGLWSYGGVGGVRIGLYNGGPSPISLLAQANGYMSTTGLLEFPTSSEVTVPAGTYWLMYLFETTTNRAMNTGGALVLTTYISYSYFSALPITYPSGFSQYSTTNANAWARGLP